MAPKVNSNCDAMDRDPLRTVTRKHLAERQRRARINKLLEQLECLVTPPASEGHVNSMKLEKAEVLEKTVDFIQRTKLGNKNQKGRENGYTKGYMECLNQIAAFLNKSELVPAQRMQLESFLMSQVNKNSDDNANNNVRLSPTDQMGTLTISPKANIQQTVSVIVQSNKSQCFSYTDSPPQHGHSPMQYDVMPRLMKSSDQTSDQLQISPVFSNDSNAAYHNVQINGSNQNCAHPFYVNQGASASMSPPSNMATLPASARKIDFGGNQVHKLTNDPLSAALNISSYLNPSKSVFQNNYFLGGGMQLQDGSVWRPW